MTPNSYRTLPTVNMTPDELIKFDQAHVWHPYSSQLNPPPLFAVERAQGVRITLSDGRELIDGMASWWSVLHGYNHPRINAAVHAQLEKMAHVMFGGLTHEPAVQLCKTLVDISPAPLTKVFLSDSGSVAVEVAMKMAYQYWISKGQKQKSQLLSLKNGYHGDTFAAMSVCDPQTGMHHLFSEVLKPQLFAPAPPIGFNRSLKPEDTQALEALLQEHHNSIAAVILEPIVQGTGGMRFYSPEYLRKVRALCDQYHCLLIADEIATGLGRTGKLFACEHADIAPDIMCLGKTLTGGYLSLAATLCSTEIAEGICHGEAGVFMHGPTFMGNPLACSAANASLELLLTSNWQQNIQQLATQLKQGLAPARALPAVNDVRILGGIGVVELHKAVDMNTIQTAFVNAGIWVRPFGKLVYIMPPYVISEDDLAFLCKQLVSVVANLD